MQQKTLRGPEREAHGLAFYGSLALVLFQRRRRVGFAGEKEAMCPCASQVLGCTHLEATVQVLALMRPPPPPSLQ